MSANMSYSDLAAQALARAALSQAHAERYQRLAAIDDEINTLRAEETRLLQEIQDDGDDFQITSHNRCPAKCESTTSISTGTNPNNADASPNMDLEQLSKIEIQQARKRKANIVSYEDGFVAISCHLCGTNAAERERIHTANPFLGLSSLHTHYTSAHKDCAEVFGKNHAEILDMCNKVTITAADMRLIARGEEPRFVSFVPTRGGDKRRRTTNSRPNRRAASLDDDVDDSINVRGRSSREDHRLDLRH